MQKQTTGKGSHLEEAMALLMQTQASFVSQLAETNRGFTGIKKELDLIKAMLLRHERILTELPEAIRQNIGFQPS